MTRLRHTVHSCLSNASRLLIKEHGRGGSMCHRRQKKYFLLFLLLIYPITAEVAYLSTLSADGMSERMCCGDPPRIVTQTYEISMTGFEEGDINPPGLTFCLKKVGSTECTIHPGDANHSRGADGTPSMFRGYEFEAGELSFFISFSRCNLYIYKDNNTSITEPIKWTRWGQCASGTDHP